MLNITEYIFIATHQLNVMISLYTHSGTAGTGTGTARYHGTWYNASSLAERRAGTGTARYGGTWYNANSLAERPASGGLVLLVLVLVRRGIAARGIMRPSRPARRATAPHSSLLIIELFQLFFTFHRIPDSFMLAEIKHKRQKHDCRELLSFMAHFNT